MNFKLSEKLAQLVALTQTLEAEYNQHSLTNAYDILEDVISLCEEIKDGFED